MKRVTASFYHLFLFCFCLSSHSSLRPRLKFLIYLMCYIYPVCLWLICFLSSNNVLLAANVLSISERLLGFHVSILLTGV